MISSKQTRCIEEANEVIARRGERERKYQNEQRVSKNKPDPLIYVCEYR